MKELQRLCFSPAVWQRKVSGPIRSCFTGQTGQAATQCTEVTVYASTALHHQGYYGVGSCVGLTVYWVRYRIIRLLWNWGKQLPCLHAQRSGCSSRRLAKFRSCCATLRRRLSAHPRTLHRQKRWVHKCCGLFDHWWCYRATGVPQEKTMLKLLKRLLKKRQRKKMQKKRNSYKNVIGEKNIVFYCGIGVTGSMK